MKISPSQAQVNSGYSSFRAENVIDGKEKVIMAKIAKKVATPESSGVLEKIAEKRAVPGVISLTGAKSLLYMNAEAEGICQQFGVDQGYVRNGDAALNIGSDNGLMGHEVLPQEVFDLCGALEQEASLNGAKSGEEIQLRRVIGEYEHPVLLRGFLIPGHQEHEPRFLILLERLGRRPQVPSNEAQRYFNLTDRELEIIMNVAEGKTNREIASLLAISEHTVKEHIKHVLQKTGSSTRTGILAQIFRLS